MMVIRMSPSASQREEADANGSHEIVPGFGPDGQVESLSYPGEVCDRLMILLRESNSLYPVARRTMSVFEVGFLERV
jgi:hypothetical protein